MKYLILASLVTLVFNAQASEYKLEACTTQLIQEEFYGECGEHGSHPCESETILLGDTEFSLTFNAQTKIGNGHIVARTVSGEKQSSSLQCSASSDRHWIECASTEPVLNGRKIYVTTNVNGIGDRSKPVFFIPVFLEGFNSPNGHVNTDSDCQKVSIPN